MRGAAVRARGRGARPRRGRRQPLPGPGLRPVARAHRRSAWFGRRAHRVRQRLRRVAGVVGAGLYRGRRRNSQQSIRVFILRHRGAVGRGRAAARAGRPGLGRGHRGVVGGGHEAHPRGLRRQPRQPDRRVFAGRCAARVASRLARRHPLGAGFRVRRIRHRRRLRRRRGVGGGRREHRHAAHLLEDLRPGRGPRRLGVWPGRGGRGVEPRAPAEQHRGTVASRGGRGVGG